MFVAWIATRQQPCSQSYSDDITMTSQWARWRLKSPASRLFTQPRHWPLWGEFTIWWSHHGKATHKSGKPGMFIICLHWVFKSYTEVVHKGVRLTLVLNYRLHGHGTCVRTIFVKQCNVSTRKVTNAKLVPLYNPLHMPDYRGPFD